MPKKAAKKGRLIIDTSSPGVLKTIMIGQ